MPDTATRSSQLDRAIADLLAQAPEVLAAAVVSFDGLPMASALPATMDEDRVAAMSAALLSLGERAAEGLGRGGLNQVYIEGEHGTVFLVSADDEAVLVAVADKGAKAGMMLYEVRRAADVVADVLRTEPTESGTENVEPPLYVPAQAQPVEAYDDDMSVEMHPDPIAVETHAEPAVEIADSEPVEPDAEPIPAYAPIASNNSWSYLPNEPASGSPEHTPWS